MTTSMTLAAALKVIEPKRSDSALLVLTACTAYLDTGEPMPVELRRWLARYLQSERCQIKSPLSIHKANLGIVRRKAANRGDKVTLAQEDFARSLGYKDSSAVKKWKPHSPEFRAINAIRDHLLKIIERQAKGRISG